MLSIAAFEALLNSPESNILDFKYGCYDFANDAGYSETAKFVKDVVSFSNTIRRETAYIIMGVEENENGSKMLHGIVRTLNDAILQDKVKDKLFPIPVFKYYTFLFDGKAYGIIEFPVIKYDTPIVAHIKMRGLEIGKVYHRRGSSNTEAQSLDIIKISDWLRELPGLPGAISVTKEISILLKRLTSGDEKMSAVFADIFHLAKTQSFADLKEFCSEELQGLKTMGKANANEELKYRIREVIISPYKITVRPNLFVKVTSAMVKQEMEKDKSGFITNRFLFSQSLSQIEDFLARPDGIVHFEHHASEIFDDSNKDEVIYLYIFRDSWEAVYASIRQKAIEKLMSI